jgi:hypothetical protein
MGKKAVGKSAATPEDAQRLIDELRAALPAVVDGQLRRGGEHEGANDAALQRWLAARAWRVDKAAADLIEHAAWREATVPAGRVLEVRRRH